MPKYTKASKYGKVFGVRFPKEIEKELIKYAIESEVNESDIIKSAVICFLSNKDCQAKKTLTLGLWHIKSLNEQVKGGDINEA